MSKFIYLPILIFAFAGCASSVIGNDSAITAAGFFGSQMDLNTTKPLMIHLILQSISLLSNSIQSFDEKTVKGIIVNINNLKTLLKGNLMVGTSLVPILGYDKVSKIIQKAHSENKLVKDVILEDKEIDENKRNELIKILELN